jgi:hypothetical protein
MTDDFGCPFRHVEAAKVLICRVGSVVAQRFALPLLSANATAHGTAHALVSDCTVDHTPLQSVRLSYRIRI